MKLLLTGYTGFIGSYLYQYLKNDNFQVDGVSLRDTALSGLFKEQYDIVIHLSGLAHQTKSIPYSEYKRINCTQTAELASYAKEAGVRHFIYFSSVKVYGNSADGNELTEFSEIKPDDSYGISKAEAEKILLSLQDQTFNVTILRIPLVFGPNPKGNIKLLLTLTDRSKLIPLNGINNRRSILSVSNLSEIIKQIIEKKIYGIFIPSDIKPISTTEIMNYLIKARKRKVLFFKLPESIKFVIRLFFNGIYIRVFGDLYFNNSASMGKIDTEKLNSSEDNFIKYYTVK
jgi:nucleoside-diphosphate-sugar epimerase